MVHSYSATIEGGEEVHLELTISGDVIGQKSWRVVGGLELLRLVREIHNQDMKYICDFKEPQGSSTSVLLLKELILKIKNEWVDGDNDLEVCHCRKVSQASIERAILLGANTIEKVRKRTSANTGCGACMVDVQSLISKRIS